MHSCWKPDIIFTFDLSEIDISRVPLGYASRIIIRGLAFSKN